MLVPVVTPVSLILYPSWNGLFLVQCVSVIGYRVVFADSTGKLPGYSVCVYSVPGVILFTEQSLG